VIWVVDSGVANEEEAEEEEEDAKDKLLLHRSWFVGIVSVGDGGKGL
jgi:hypothetical protein